MRCETVSHGMGRELNTKLPSKGLNGLRNRIRRLIVVTDEQAHDVVPGPPAGVDIGYMVNVAPYRNEVGYGDWIRVNGFSESIVDWIVEFEKIAQG